MLPLKRNPWAFSHSVTLHNLQLIVFLYLFACYGTDQQSRKKMNGFHKKKKTVCCIDLYSRPLALILNNSYCTSWCIRIWWLDNCQSYIPLLRVIRQNTLLKERKTKSYLLWAMHSKHVEMCSGQVMPKCGSLATCKTLWFLENDMLHIPLNTQHLL